MNKAIEKKIVCFYSFAECFGQMVETVKLTVRNQCLYWWIISVYF